MEESLSTEIERKQLIQYGHVKKVPVIRCTPPGRGRRWRLRKKESQKL